MRRVGWLGAIATAGMLVAAASQGGFSQGARPNFDPVVVETPWGQHVVPTIDTYIELQIYDN